jgi:hypothetical protein
MYPLKYHPGLEKRWQTFPEYQQIIMIANELNRARNMLQQEDVYEMKQALERAFELVDLTIEYARHTLRYELLRFRELLGESYLDPDPQKHFFEKIMKTLLTLNSEAFTQLN